jgi:hypothetical protein
LDRHVQAIEREGERIRTHYVIASLVARWTSGEARLSDEVDAVDWVDPAAGSPSPTTLGLGEILRARRGSKVSALEPRDLRPLNPWLLVQLQVEPVISSRRGSARSR